MVTVGDSQTGKTSLLCALKDGKLSPDKEIPGIFQTFSHKLKVDGHKVELGLWDTSGEVKYDGLRRLAYPTCDAFIVCYSVNSRESFENVSKVWLPELQRYGPPSAPIVIVGTKQDSRPRASLIPNGSSGGVTQQKFVNYEEGMRLADESRANAFVECSALSENGVSGVFAEAVKAVLKHIKDDKRRRSSGGISIRGLLPGHSAK
jgi:Ras-related C3 botulinum toxin substrate 1